MNALNRTSLAVVASVVAIASASADTIYYVAPGANKFYNSTSDYIFSGFNYSYSH